MIVGTCKPFSKENCHDKSSKNATGDKRYGGEKGAFSNSSLEKHCDSFSEMIVS